MKICNFPACHTLISMKRTHCKKHGTKQIVYSRYVRNKKREKFYNSGAWKKKRKEMMQYYNGLCQICAGKDITRMANVVDHIKELKDYPELGLENSNLVTLCHSCHNAKSLEYRKNK